MTVPWLSLIVAAPFLGALLTGTNRDRDVGRGVAAAAALTQLALTIGVIAWFNQDGPGYFLREEYAIPGSSWVRWGLGLDGLSSLFLPLIPLIASGVLLAGPRRRLDPGYISAVLLTAATSAATVLATDVGLLAAMWFASLGPNFAMLKRHSRPVIRDELRRSYTLYLFAGSLPLFLAASRIGFYGRHVNPDSPFDLAHLTAHPLPIAAQPLVLGLVLVPVLVRMGVFPLHSWMPLHIEHGPLGIGVMTLGTNLGVYVLARTVPVVPDAAQDWMPHLAYLALGSGLFGSTLAVVQTNLRRAVGFLVVSQSSLMLLGLASMTGPGVHGALLQALASGGALGGLLILVWALEARTGTSDYRHFGGFARSMPRMATVFFVFSAASVGFPGTLMFISEDLIIQGIVEQAPAVTAAVLFAMAANGYVLFRAFSRTFLGASDEVADVLDPNFTVEDSGRDLLPRERLVAVGFAAVVVLAGLWPQPLLTLTEPAVYPIARHDPGPTDAHHAAASPPAPRSDAPQATAHN